MPVISSEDLYGTKEARVEITVRRTFSVPAGLFQFYFYDGDDDEIEVVNNPKNAKEIMECINREVVNGVAPLATLDNFGILTGHTPINWEIEIVDA